MQILQIKTASMREHNRLAKDAEARMPELAARTKNFSGAEIEGLCKAAASYALRRGVDAGSDDAGMTLDDSKLVVAYEDFDRALNSGEARITPGRLLPRRWRGGSDSRVYAAGERRVRRQGGRALALFRERHHRLRRASEGSAQYTAPPRGPGNEPARPPPPPSPCTTESV